MFLLILGSDPVCPYTLYKNSSRGKEKLSLPLFLRNKIPLVLEDKWYLVSCIYQNKELSVGVPFPTFLLTQGVCSSTVSTSITL